MKEKTNDIFLHILFIIIALVCILPVVLVFMISLTSEREILLNGYTFFPKEITLSAYEYLFKDFDALATGYKNTFINIILGTTSNVIIISLYGYALSRKDFPFRGFFSVLVLITMLFSGGMAPAYYINVNVLGLKNTHIILILSGIGIGFDAFMMKSYFASNVPFEIIESGKIDGAGEGRIFFQLVWPMAIPIVATVALKSAIAYWNEFQTCMLYIEDEDLYTLQYTMQRALMNVSYIKEMISMGVAGADQALADLPTEGARMAMTIFGIGPIIFAYPFFQRFFISGLTVGAVKG